MLVGYIVYDLHSAWQREQDKIIVMKGDKGSYRMKFDLKKILAKIDSFETLSLRISPVGEAPKNIPHSLTHPRIKKRKNHELGHRGWQLEQICTTALLTGY